MGQVTIYLKSDTEKKGKAFAKKSNLSFSKWINQLIDEKASNEWPESVKSLPGSWNDFPTLNEIRESYGPDTNKGEF